MLFKDLQKGQVFRWVHGSGVKHIRAAEDFLYFDTELGKLLDANEYPFLIESGVVLLAFPGKWEIKPHE
jgi:hypothetical protein